MKHYAVLGQVPGDRSIRLHSVSLLRFASVAGILVPSDSRPENRRRIAAAKPMTRLYPYHHAALLAALLVPLASHAQVQECTPQSMVGTRPGQTGTVVVCSPALASDPVIRGLAARLNDLAARTDDLGHSVRRLAPAINGSADALSLAQKRVLAASVSRQLQIDSARTEARMSREIDRLRLSFEDFQDKVTAALSDPARQGDVRSALGGPAGEALARLDFNTAQKILDDLAQIKTNTLSACAKDPKLLQITRSEAEGALAKLRSQDAPKRCPKAWPTLMAFYESASAALGRNDLNAACSGFEEFKMRAMMAQGELYSRQFNSTLALSQMKFHSDLYRQQYEAMLQRVTRSNRVLAERNANTQELRQELLRANETLQRAQAEAANERYGEAWALLVDVTNQYRSIEFRGGGYDTPFVPIPRPQIKTAEDIRRDMEAQAESQATTIQAAGLSVCR